jgi:FkbH-like protein
MKNKENLKKLNFYLQDPAFLDLEVNLAMQMAKRLKKNKKLLKNKFNKIKLSILSNFNIDFIVETINFCLYQKGIDAEITTPSYGTMFTELLNAKSKTYKNKPDYILIWPSHKDIQKYNYNPKAEISFWQSLWLTSKKNNIKIFQVLFDKPPYIHLNSPTNIKNNLVSHINQTNIQLEKKYGDEVSFIPIDQLQINIGSKNWHDARMYNICKQPFSLEAIPEISQFISSYLAGYLGKNKKALILDLDNTIWGGEIGDLGTEGIILGKETSDGESFTNFQEYIKELHKTGIILCVCSKNDEVIAKEVFKMHADMKIKLKDISCFVANFKDKASNITYIKKFLNIGYDSIVFVDDSKIECEWVRKKLPDVTTINLTGDPSGFANKIDRLGLFLKGPQTKEDKKRISSYKTLKKIEQIKSSSHSLENFLKSLDPKIFIEDPFPYAAERIEQLLYKTNQFKLNNTIFKKSTIKENQKNILALRFIDNLNDYGIVVVVLYNIKKEVLHIKNWVMSCRVFSRNIEFAVLDILNKIAKYKSCKKITLEFSKSSKNGPAETAIKNLGFNPIKKTSLYEVYTDNKIYKHFITFQNLEKVIKNG